LIAHLPPSWIQRPLCAAALHPLYRCQQRCIAKKGPTKSNCCLDWNISVGELCARAENWTTFLVLTLSSLVPSKSSPFALLAKYQAIVRHESPLCLCQVACRHLGLGPRGWQSRGHPKKSKCPNFSVPELPHL
jgi:hypothetical protein